MSKKKLLKIGLMAFIFAFGLFISGVAAEEECWDCPGGGPTLSGNHGYPEGWVCTADPDMEYDRENSTETVSQNSSATIFVIGNNAPYTWTVTGTGFSLSHATTTGLSNTLVADGAACGTATITITGCDGKEVVDYVRCTIGFWVTCASKAYTATGPGSCTSAQIGSCLAGKFRYRRQYSTGSFRSGCSPNGLSCAATVTCDGDIISVESIAGDIRNDCDYDGDLCRDTSGGIWYEYWDCPY